MPIDEPKALLLRALVVPCALITMATASSLGGIDRALSDLFFDGASGRFPLRHHGLLELLGHHLAKSLAVIVWLGLFCLAAAATWLEAWRPWRAVLWATVGAMAAGPAVVVALKSFTALPCPWSLTRYGGFAAEATSWLATPASAGRCFPAGHSAGGFSFLAFGFAAHAIGRPRLARLAWLVALSVGAAFSAVRIAQGAHFLSHALWSGAIDWLAAAIVFLAIPGAVPGTSVNRQSPGRR